MQLRCRITRSTRCAPNCFRQVAYNQLFIDRTWIAGVDKPLGILKGEWLLGRSWATWGQNRCQRRAMWLFINVFLHNQNSVEIILPKHRFGRKRGFPLLWQPRMYQINNSLVYFIANNSKKIICKRQLQIKFAGMNEKILRSNPGGRDKYYMEVGWGPIEVRGLWTLPNEMLSLLGI